MALLAPASRSPALGLALCALCTLVSAPARAETAYQSWWLSVELYTEDVRCDPNLHLCTSNAARYVAPQSIRSQANVAPTGRADSDGFALYAQLPLGQGVVGSLQIDVSQVRGAGDWQHVKYIETDHGEVVFTSASVQGTIQVASPDCLCQGAGLELRFSDGDKLRYFSGGWATPPTLACPWGPRLELGSGLLRVGYASCPYGTPAPKPAPKPSPYEPDPYNDPDPYYDPGPPVYIDVGGGCGVDESPPSDSYDEGGCGGEDSPSSDSYDSGGCESDGSSDYGGGGGCEGDSGGGEGCEGDSGGSDGCESGGSSSCEGDAFAGTGRSVGRRPRHRTQLRLQHILLALLALRLVTRRRRRRRAL